MYESVSQPTYTNQSYYSVRPLPTQIPNSAPVIHPRPVPDPFATYGPYPPPNYAAFGPQPGYYTGSNAISYGVQPSASHGTNIDNLIGQSPQVLRKMVKRPKGPKVMSKKKRKSVSQNIWCNLCKVECGSTEHYEKHLTGKKHNKSLKLMSANITSAAGQSSLSGNNASVTAALGGQGTPTVSSVPENLETKKQKLLGGGVATQSLRVCTICNVACNGEIAFSDHLVGKKHIALERALQAKPKTSTSFGNDHGTNTQKTSKTPVVGLAWCELCKISCTSSGVVCHQQGKKHKKNLENFLKSISGTTGLVSTSTPVGPVNVPNVVEGYPSEVAQVTLPRSIAPEVLGAKKRKFLPF